MDRRSFLASLIGGLSMASLGGIAAAAAKDAGPETTGPETLPQADAAALDKAEAEYAQYYYYGRPRRRYRRRYYGYRPYRYGYRPYYRPYRRYYRRRYYRPYSRF